MSEPTHSQLPWRRDRADHLIDANDNRIGSLFGAGTLVDEHNAILVIAAVNSHAELLAAAKDVLRVFIDHDLIETAPAAVRALRAAITAAESLT